MLAPLALALQLQVAPDTALFPPKEELLRLYTNCDESRWPYGTDERFVPKTHEELVAGVARRRALEGGWRRWFRARAGDSLAVTADDQRVFPFDVPGRLLNNYPERRAGGIHEALDIFAPREGTVIRSPVAGVVIAAGDGWRGGWKRRVGLQYEGGGLSRRAGNGMIVFEPGAGAYYYFAHMHDTLAVRAGDVVRAGAAVGSVGHSGNASQPGHGRHLHFATKHPGTACDVEGVLVAEDPYVWLRAARRRLSGSR